MSRIVLNHIELTEINGKVWIYDRAEGAGRFVAVEEIAALLKQKDRAANTASSETTIEEV